MRCVWECARAVHSTYTFSQFVALDSRWFLHRSEACSLHKNWERESKKRSYHMNHLFLFCSVVSPLLVIKWWSKIRRWLTNGALSVCARYYIVLSMGVNGFFSNKIANQMNSIGWAVCKNAETINGIVNRRHNRSNYLIRISVVLVLAIPRLAFAMIIISSITMRKEERRKKHIETNQLIYFNTLRCNESVVCVIAATYNCCIFNSCAAYFFFLWGVWPQAVHKYIICNTRAILKWAKWKMKNKKHKNFRNNLEFLPPRRYVCMLPTGISQKNCLSARAHESKP